MFRGLRFRLTLLYLVAALGLIVLLGGGTYLLLHDYFQASTDLALRFRMALEFEARGLALPPDLADAASAWNAHRPTPRPAASPSPPPPPTETAVLAQGEGEEEGEDNGGHSNGRSANGSTVSSGDGAEAVSREIESGETEAYDGELTAIFTLPLTAEGRLISNPNPYTPPIAPSVAGIIGALSRGRDLRTVKASDGSDVRLLTYRIAGPDGAQVLQVGRTMSDQERALNRLLIILVSLGTLGAAALAVASWWLAGRSLVPAQHAWEKQQTFVANASHELRTPLTLIRASTEVARRGLPADDERSGLLGDVLQETDHMSHLVEELLLLSRLDAGKLTLASETIDVPPLLADLQRQVGRLAETKGVTVTLAESDGSAIGDPTRLRQVLLALLDNAVQNTPAGGRVELDSRVAGKTVVVRVTDTGRGLSAADQAHVSERFFRTEGSPSGGSGLGLAIARGLIEAQHGQLTLTSAPGEGTRVAVTLPRA
jgi:signal transduction histidine kinase